MSILGKSKGRPTTRIQFDAIVKRFLIFLKTELRMNQDIPFILIDDANFSKQKKAFGMMDNKIIYVSIINRHPMDILRTFAHEVVHYKQHLERGPQSRSSRAGSATENQANAKAGELMRRYGQLHPDLFDLMPIR